MAPPDDNVAQMPRTDRRGRVETALRKLGRGHRKNPERERQAEAMFEAGATEPEVVEATGIAAGTANTIHRVVEARREEREKRARTEDQILAVTEAGFSEKSKLKLTDAIRIYKKRLDREFEPRVSAEVQKRIETADSFVRQQLKALEAVNAGLEKILKGKGVFTRLEYRQLQMAVHPDNTASVDVRNRLLDIIVKNEAHLVKREV